jgi:hypothetical protein
MVPREFSVSVKSIPAAGGPVKEVVCSGSSIGMFMHSHMRVTVSGLVENGAIVSALAD